MLRNITAAQKCAWEFCNSMIAFFRMVQKMQNNMFPRLKN